MLSHPMVASTLSRGAPRAISPVVRQSHKFLYRRFFATSRLHSYPTHLRSFGLTSSAAQSRPRLGSSLQSRVSPTAATARPIFIQTETTPNADALKFVPNQTVVPENYPTRFIEYLSPRSTLAQPYPSPLASKLISVEGVSAVSFGPDFITITRSESANWAYIKPEIYSLITETVTQGEPFVNFVDQKAPENASETGVDGSATSQQTDSLAYNEEDEEVISMIKELLDTRIRPAIQEDGGDIEFRGFDNGRVLLKLRGACRTCDSSTVTLKNGIEAMLMHYIEEVEGVTQVMDEEEQIAMQEFEKFEQKLQQQKGEGAARR